jgi:hypothetical protein
LTDAGLEAYRPKQRFILAKTLKRFRQKGECDIYKGQGQTGGSELWLDGSLLRPFQRDVLVKLDKIRRLSVEVKALCPAAFNFYNIHVGCCPKWDKKLELPGQMAKINILILINSATGEAYAVQPMEGWLRVKTKGGGGDTLDYAVPRHLLSPLDIWVDSVKDGLYQG